MFKKDCRESSPPSRSSLAYSSRCKAVRKKAAFWVKCSARMPESLVRYVQVVTAKTVTTMMRTTLVAYPVHVALLKFSVEFCRCLLENERTAAE